MNKIFCLVGGSGSGKSTLRDLVPIQSIVFYTTRPKRPWEKDGHDAIFVDEKEYEEQKRMGLIVAETGYPPSPYKYWISFSAMRDLVHTPLICIATMDIVEDLRLMYGFERVVAIYLDAPFEVLEQRMRARGDSEEEIALRRQRWEQFDTDVKERCDIVVDATKNKEELVNLLSRIILEQIFGK